MRAPVWRLALLFCAVQFIAAAPFPARAVTEIMWWHAMSGELGRQLGRLATQFNESQSEYRIVPVYKGNYTETVTAAIFAFRSRTQPAIVQVNEIATATMMAAQGAIYPVFELMSRGTCCRFRSMSPPQSSTTTRTCSAPPVSIPGVRRRPGPSSGRTRASCARPGSLAASPRRGRHGSMSRASSPCTICRSQRAPTDSPVSTLSSSSTIR
jgi:hypothetical protein